MESTPFVRAAQSTPLCFYDNRQKYLASVTTCNEKAVIAARCAEMHTLPSEIGDRIGTSTLFAAWNAVICVNQIEDERLEKAPFEGQYLGVSQDVLRRHGALWFNDEAFVVRRNRHG